MMGLVDSWYTCSPASPCLAERLNSGMIGCSAGFTFFVEDLPGSFRPDPPGEDATEMITGRSSVMDGREMKTFFVRSDVELYPKCSSPTKSANVGIRSEISAKPAGMGRETGDDSLTGFLPVPGEAVTWAHEGSSPGMTLNSGISAGYLQAVLFPSTQTRSCGFRERHTISS